MCREFNSLPSQGGLLDQDQLIVRKMMIVLSAQSEKHDKDRKAQDQKQHKGKRQR